MNIELLKKIKQDVLSIPLVEKTKSEEFAGVYLHSNSPFTLEEHAGPIHSFFAFSEKRYPLYLFLSSDTYTDDLREILYTYRDIRLMYIRQLTSVVDFNYFSIYELPYLIPGEKLLYLQSDGFLIKSGWENLVCDYSFIGAKWKNPIKVIETTFNFPAVTVGNGGFNFRKRTKMIEVLNLVNENGGQNNIVKGIAVNHNNVNPGPFLAEDLFFAYFGFGAGIYEPVTHNQADKFSLEPITFTEFLNKKSHGFHRIDNYD